MRQVARVASAHHGAGGAVAAAHPAATEAGLGVLERGGSAVDAAIAAQAVICVVLPQAAGIGGDLMALVHDDGRVHAITGAGRSPRAGAFAVAASGGASVTVPGLVDGWLTLHSRWGRLPLPDVLSTATGLACNGAPLDPSVVAAVGTQSPRLVAGGAAEWGLLTAAAGPPGTVWVQPELGALLQAVADRGRAAFYDGLAAAAIVSAVRRTGGLLDADDLGEHRTDCPDPIDVRFVDGTAYVQPPPSQGVLLAMALQAVRRPAGAAGHPALEHLLVEIVGAVFEHRARCGRGQELLSAVLDVDEEHASGRTGPRGYLHTAGVATSDAAGQVVSSLVSVFDDFGSGVYVPELGIVLTNRAAGFTEGENAPGPGKRPVHTLAPALVTGPGGVIGLATPGADGQVQTLLQVLTSTGFRGIDLPMALAAPRWRSQDGRLLVEEGHPEVEALRDRGHDVELQVPGSELFGAVVAAGIGASSGSGSGSGGPWAVADWRRTTTSGAVA